MGKQFREARLAGEMTQPELGNALGISFQQVQKYERGTNRIGASRLWYICKVLEVTAVHFLEGLVQGGKEEPEVSLEAVKLAKGIDEIQNDDMKMHFLRLVRPYPRFA